MPQKKQQGSIQVEINENLCKGCDICIEFCPTDVFEKSSKLNRKGYYLPVISKAEACNACLICELMCPEMSIVITVTHQPGEAKAG